MKYDLEKSKEIIQAIDEIDTTNLERQTLVEIEVPKEFCLVMKNVNKFDLKFLQSICTATDEDKYKIDVLIQIDSTLKPIGSLSMRFEIMKRIKAYNPDIKIGIYEPDTGKIIGLKDEDYLFIP